MMTQARLDNLAAKTAETVACASCLGKGYVEMHGLDRDPVCPLCVKGQVPKHPDLLDLVVEVMRLRYLLKHTSQPQ